VICDLLKGEEAPQFCNKQWFDEGASEGFLEKQTTGAAKVSGQQVPWVGVGRLV
jgi:hypothetical protein